MVTTSFAKLRTQLDIDLRDADNFTFTSVEKDELVRSCIEDDPSMFGITVDSSQTLTANQATYASPFDEVTGLGFDAFSDGSIEPIPRSAWEEYGGEIRFNHDWIARYNGVTLYIYGVGGYSQKSLIPGSMRAYVIANAIVRSVDLLQAGKVNRFLRNDTTMGEMQMLRTNKLAEANRLRTRLRNRRSVRF